MRKNQFLAKVLSFVLALAMVVTLLPSSLGQVVKAAGVMNVTLHYKNASSWENPTIQYWGDGITTAGGGAESVIPGWGTTKGVALTAESNKFYSISLKGGVTGFQFLDLNKANDTKTGTLYQSTMAAYTGETPTDLYYIDGTWYLDAEKTTAMPMPASARNVFTFVGDEALAGENWNDKSTTNLLVQDSEDTNKYSITLTDVKVGNYSYKVLQDAENYGWDKAWGVGEGDSGNRLLSVEAPSDIIFTIDVTDADKNVNVTINKKTGGALTLSTEYAVKGGTNQLSSKASYFDGTNTTTVNDVTYALKTATEGVSIENNVVTVASTFTGTQIDVVASHGAFKQDAKLEVVNHLYNVKFNMYAQDLEMTPGVSDIYVFDKTSGSVKNTFVQTTGTYEDEDNGITWVTGNVKLPYNHFKCIVRDKAGVWAGQDGNGMEVTIPEATTTPVELWYVYGKTPVTEKPVVQNEDQRYFYLEYENKTVKEAGIIPEFYSWTTGYAAARTPFEDKGDGKWAIKVPVKATCSKVSFVIAVDDGKESQWVKDGGDHNMAMPLTQTVVYASMKEGQEPTLSCPYNIGYELQPKQDQISFYYRDDAALLEGKLAELEPKVEINGKEETMKYNELNRRFEYVQKGLTDGRMDYRYHIGEDYLLDKYNDNKETKSDVEYSYVDYYKLKSTVNATVLNASFNSDENDVVKFEMAGDDADKVKVSKATIDVSSLGGSKTMPIESQLQAVSISATNTTKLGKKNYQS